jgi:hypothetical protein
LKKYLPYLFAVLLAGGIIALFLTGNNKKNRRIDERVTLRRQDKIPYGTYVAYKGLAHLFPRARVLVNRDEPGYWDSLSSDESNQALIIITGKFNADEIEMKNLINFIEKGNDVFISARNLSYSASEILECKTELSSFRMDDGQEIEESDSLQLRLKTPPYDSAFRFSYPGKKLHASFVKVNEATTEVLGTDRTGLSDFIRLQAGRGNIYIHLAPLAFSNYFLLHRDNIGYYEKVLSVINPQTKKIAWDEYYLNKKFSDNEEEKKRGWFDVLMNVENENGQHSFRAAFWVLLILLVAYILLEMRRKQRYIPVVTKPRNDSLDFVRTIGRLYFDKGDHKNLCRKMAAYFLEHVRSKYKLLTGVLDDEFVSKLQHKSGVEEWEIRGIVSFIKYIDDAPGINHKQLADFHKQLEAFYKKA